jgi:hypothetical protein
MERFVMTRTKLARTVVRSVIASTTVPSSAISQPTSSVVSVVTLVIWPKIARIDNVVLIGAMDRRLQEVSLVVLELRLAGLVPVMLLTASTR